MNTEIPKFTTEFFCFIVNFSSIQVWNFVNAFYNKINVI